MVTKIYPHSVNGPLYNHGQLNGPDDKYVSRFRMDKDTNLHHWQKVEALAIELAHPVINPI